MSLLRLSWDDNVLQMISLLNCLRKSRIAWCWRQVLKPERTCLLAVPTETKDVQVFFIRRFMGLKQLYFVQTNSGGRVTQSQGAVSACLCSSSRNSSLHLGHLTVWWFMSWLIFLCYKLHLHRRNRTVCTVSFEEGTDFLANTAALQQVKLIQVLDKTMSVDVTQWFWSVERMTKQCLLGLADFFSLASRPEVQARKT